MRLRPLLTYATVASVGAFAVGGGLSVAVGGGGKKDKATKAAIVAQASAVLESGVPGGARKKLLDLPGMGTLSASRAQSAPGGGIFYTNTTNTTFEVSEARFGSQSAEPEVTLSGYAVEPGGTYYFGQTSSVIAAWATIFPADAKKESPQVELLVRASPGGSRVLVEGATGGVKGKVAKTAVVREASANLHGAGEAQELVEIPGVGELTAGCGSGVAAVRYENTTSQPFEFKELQALSNTSTVAAKSGVVEAGGSADFAYDGEVENLSSNHWISLYPEDSTVAAPHIELLVSAAGATCDVRAFVLGEKRGKDKAAKPAALRQASLDLSADQEDKKLLDLPGLGRFSGTCESSGESGHIDFRNTSSRTVGVNVIENNASYGAAARSDTVEPGDLLHPPIFVEQIDEKRTTHLLSIFPLDADRQGPFARVRLNVRGCGMTASAVGAKR